MSLPKRTCISDVLITDCNDSNLNIKAREGYTYYLGTGNLFTKTEWLNGGTNPVTTYTYDPYGDVATIKDARNYTTTISYDSTYTYPVQMTNPLGHAVSKAYDARFGKPLTETDQNNNTTTYTYDVFGRIVIITNPYDTSSTYGTVSYYYLNFGTVGSQKVMAYNTEQSGTGNYILTETYFDGLGRTIKTRAEGPDNKTIASQTIYNTMQQVASESLPFFEGETPRYKTYEYDPIGRIKKATLPDGTYATSSYLKGILTYIDPNGHKKVEEKDIYGRAIKIEEYLGVSPSFTLYATTRYEYNVLGNMTKVTDAANNLTIIAYDTLSRKTSMTDPDMGYWTYQYDANGNLTSQTDAKNQTILFTYDALNRITKKDYPTGTDVVYTYDDRIYYF
ncbi:MAG: RHS repeat protein [Nitrospirae bacterium]|nr:RHS repeat protein [Nitrospirota bacterium]